jgi:hypothetical protein
MTNKYKYLVFSILMAVSINYVTGQETNFASNISRYLSFDGKLLVIKYDLVFPDTTQLFDIILNLYYNGKLIQPQDNALTGSWGNKVAPGKDLVITWDFPSEYKDYINKITVDVVASKRIETLADFEYKISGKKPPFNVKFENKSKNADIYSWRFGDVKSGENNLSTLENPVHNYKSRGTYEVELTAGNSKTNENRNILKPVSIGKGNEQDLQKHKTLKTIWLGSAIATAGFGGFCMLKYYKLEDKYRTSDDLEFRKEAKTYRTVGIATLVVSGACISQVIIQSKKIRAVEKPMSMNLIPVEKGCVLGLALNF